jgi:succinate dehydrogenase flavin-adding protein (antitoxin of CptAB toxin-antitoxin module)
MSRLEEIREREAKRWDYARLWGDAVARGIEWMDHVIDNAAKGDWAQLIQDVGDDLNAVDAVDDDSIKRWNAAKEQADRTTELLEQVATLTAERDEARQRLEDMAVVLAAGFAEAADLEEQRDAALLRAES